MLRGMKTAFAACAAALLAAACASSKGPCDGGVVTKLYLHRATPGGGRVDDEALRAFLDEVVSVQFPTGYAVLHGEGYWKPGPDEPARREDVVVLEFVRCDEKATEPALVEVGKAWAERFRHTSILRTDAPARIDW